jgi:hypothetical protein
VKNRFDRAFRNARFAVNALIGMDVQHRVAFVKALDGTNHDAIGVSAAIARLGNYMCHKFVLLEAILSRQIILKSN